ncbi:hypothetical protein RvY_12214 [Ramazzottius varieornatus]|uniref:Uncharacterized protein n=1 Tax=Ramazzottius varieornatus TaxID=947166 RepID=A0A1D1VIT4_RAMVA|nr:hypothetical protein RvY_12214 [Ramazzottius varieornatus]
MDDDEDDVAYLETGSCASDLPEDDAEVSAEPDATEVGDEQTDTESDDEMFYVNSAMSDLS